MIKFSLLPSSRIFLPTFPIDWHPLEHAQCWKQLVLIDHINNQDLLIDNLCQEIRNVLTSRPAYSTAYINRFIYSNQLSLNCRLVQIDSWDLHKINLTLYRYCKPWNSRGRLINNQKNLLLVILRLILKMFFLLLVLKWQRNLSEPFFSDSNEL